MLQAILITAYKDFFHLLDIVSYFDNSFKIYIHIDKKSLDFNSIKNKLLENDNVILVSNNLNVNWGGRNHLKAILLLMAEAIKNNKIERFHLISGHDFPTKSNQEFVSFFKENYTEYINCLEMPIERWPEGGFDRLDYYNFYDFINAKKNRKLIKKIVNFQKKISFKRIKVKNKIKLYGGETWWSLSKDAVNYIIDYTKKEPYLYKRMKFTFCSEEIYIPTVLMNSHLRYNINVNYLRYIDWNDRNGNFPANLDINDYKKIQMGLFFFARKFSFPVSNELKEKLQSKL